MKYTEVILIEIYIYKSNLELNKYSLLVNSAYSIFVIELNLHEIEPRVYKRVYCFGVYI